MLLSKEESKNLLSADASTYAHFLFNAFDLDRNGSIRFEDFVIGLSVLLRGSVTEKLNWAFNLYDINKDGYITKEVCVKSCDSQLCRHEIIIFFFITKETFFTRAAIDLQIYLEE